jgi:DNA polymerase-3 subunit delta
MQAQTFEGVARAVKRGELGPAYYLYGPEDLLKDELVRTLLDRALEPSLRDFNLDQRSAAELDPETILTLCQTPPMMAARRVVLVRDIEAWKRKPKARAAVLAYLERPAPDTLVILVQASGDESEDRELVQRTVAIECGALPAERAARWVLHRAKGLDLAIEPAAAEHLVRVAGTALKPLELELEKLAALGDPDPVTAERIATLVGVRHGETVYDWRDAVLGDEPARAATLLGPVLGQAGVTGVRLLTLIGTSLAGLGATRSLYDDRVTGARLEGAAFSLLLRARPYGLLPYKEEARRWARWAPRWDSARIRAALRAALAADTALKSTTISDERGILLDLVLRLGLAEREVA